MWTVALIPVYLLDLPGGSVIEHLVVLVRERLPYGVKVRVDGHRCLKYYIIQTLFTGKKNNALVHEQKNIEDAITREYMKYYSGVC